ncbi:MAG: M56 family metallopeptidase, partial [Abditibacteriales bacterium]|nr:M56 family metallopeptidase [Abditibacteriales bacterium]MDW8366606.1 M56 family metallopeptidase [Abditibacteriales bacterium]
RVRWTVMPPSRKLRKAIAQTSGPRDVHAPPIFETAEDIPGAAMVGWFKPRCLVAQSFVKAANVAELRVALRHELAHAARRDNLVRVVVKLCHKLLFFFPPARWLCREWEKCVEFACDDAAVQTPRDALHLASALVKACRFSARATQGMSLIGDWSTLEQRVQRLLGGQAKSAPSQPQFGLPLLVFAAGSFIVLAGAVAASFDLSLHCAVETLVRLVGMGWQGRPLLLYPHAS